MSEKKPKKALSEVVHKLDITNLGETISKNLRYLIKNNEFDLGAITNDRQEKIHKISQRKLADVLQVSSTTVNSWCKNGGSIPSASMIYMLGKGFGVNADFILTAHDKFLAKNEYTYWSAFNILYDLKNIIHISTANSDIFLQYLLSEAEKLDSIHSVDNEYKFQWKNKICQDFDKPLIQDTTFSTLCYYSLCSRKDITEVSYAKMIEIFNILTSYMAEHANNHSFTGFMKYCDEHDIAYDSEEFGVYLENERLNLSEGNK